MNAYVTHGVNATGGNLPETKVSAAMMSVKAAGDDAGPGTFEAVLSAPTVDRDGEIIDAGAFDPLPDHIPIDVDHWMSAEKTVGSGRPYYDGDVLKIAGTFASTPRAQELRALVAEGHVRHMSVAFMNAARHNDDEGRTHILKAELLNAAFVPVPSNREAVILAAKAAAIRAALKVGARNNAEDAARIQALHDIAGELGAECGSKSAAPKKTSDGADPETAAAPAAAAPADAHGSKEALALIARARAQLARNFLSTS